MDCVVVCWVLFHYVNPSIINGRPSYAWCAVEYDDKKQTKQTNKQTNAKAAFLYYLPPDHVFHRCFVFGDSTVFCRYTITTFRNIVQRGGHLPSLIAAPPVAVETFMDLLQVCARCVCVCMSTPHSLPGPYQRITWTRSGGHRLGTVTSSPVHTLVGRKMGMVGFEPVPFGCIVVDVKWYLLKHWATV